MRKRPVGYEPPREAAITTSGRELRQLRADVAPSLGTLVVAAGVVGFGLAVFLLIADDLLDGGGLISHDQAVLAWFVAVRTDVLVRIAKIVSALGSFVSLAAFSALVAVLLRARGWCLALATAPFVALLVASLASTGAKLIFGRPRPPVAVHATTVTLAAFPSGHATDATACLLAASMILALTLATHRWVQYIIVAAGLSVATLVGLSRLVLGVHWLSDVVAGWALGVAIATAIVVATWYWIARYGRPGPTDRGQADDSDAAAGCG